MQQTISGIDRQNTTNHRNGDTVGDQEWRKHEVSVKRAVQNINSLGLRQENELKTMI